MNRIHDVVEGDTIKPFRVRFYSTNIAATCKMVVVRGEEGDADYFRMERDMQHLGNNVWEYRWVPSDFDVVGFDTGSYAAQGQALFSDGSPGTYPTKGTMTVRVYRKL